MKIEKRGNSYRVRKTYQKQTITISFDHKPTQKEIALAMADRIKNIDDRKKNKTFEHGANEFIDAREATLSPSTVVGYKAIVRRLSDEFKQTKLKEIGTPEVQKEVARLCEKSAPKTVRNAHSFITSVLKYFEPNIIINTRLPEKEQNERYVPSDDEMQKLFDYFKGKDEELPLLLMKQGMRRSEVFALTKSDLDENNYLTINKALVQNENKEWVVKGTKTPQSNRVILLNSYTADLFRKKEVIYDGTPSALFNHVYRAQDKLGLPHFGLHSFRHYFASVCAENGIPILYVEQYGGWKRNSKVLQETYTHTIKEKEKSMQEMIVSAMDNF